MTQNQDKPLDGKPLPEPPEGLLTLEELAQVADRSDQFTRATMDKLRLLVRSLEQFAPQLAYLDALAEDAGLGETRDDRLYAGLLGNQELDRLVEAKASLHPAKVLDPDGSLGIDYSELIHIAEARACRLGEPATLEAIRDKLEGARTAEKTTDDCMGTIVTALLALDPEDALILLRRVRRVYHAHRQQQTDEPGAVEAST